MIGPFLQIFNSAAVSYRIVVDRIIYFRHKNWYSNFCLLKVQSSLDFHLVKRCFSLISPFRKKQKSGNVIILTNLGCHLERSYTFNWKKRRRLLFW